MVSRVVLVAALLGVSQLCAAQSSCMKYSDADTCRSSTEAETGDRCVWCTCAAVPSECLGAGLAKKLPSAIFKCDDPAVIAEGEAVFSPQGAPSLEAWAQAPPADVDEVLRRTPDLFESWKAKHGVRYASREEEAARQEAFAVTLEQVARHNLGGGSSYALTLNRFADMSWEEFRATRLGFGGVGSRQNCSATHTKGQFRSRGLAVPPSMDWREVGAVSPVKDQGSCGSCWTFSTTGCLESHTYLSTGKMVLLSEQQLVDCADAFDNNGCRGGLPSHAFEYIAYNGGLDSEAAYPYTAEDEGACSFVSSGVVAEVQRSVNITFQDEAELLEAVGTVGPVSIAFQVANDFKSFAFGVYDNPACATSPDQVNHAVLAVGYGTDEDLGDFWLVKNSWGSDWGLDGYFKIARGKNMCGLADCASYPDV